MPEFEKQRENMVQQQIEARGVRDELVLNAMRRVKREDFVPDAFLSCAYDDRPLPIPARQTISQPFIVGYMIEALALKGGEKVLEIGTGSGYAAAVLAEIASKVYTVERIRKLADIAAKTLEEQGYDNVHVLHADGTKGWDEFAPFDAILVSAGATSIPENLKNQLITGGRLIIPVGAHSFAQQVVRITRRKDGHFDVEKLATVQFVPLIGDES
ncbi:MAG: protein-L-isoaspartate(D-aspartate) O-methyltransferase [Rhizobiaceae bacterium]